MKNNNTFNLLLKSIFPNWKFFERNSFHYQIFYQDLSLEVTPTLWTELPTTLSRADLRLILNQKINLQHALNSTLERWVHILQQENFTPENIQSYPEFKILCGFIANKLNNSATSAEKCYFNFKIECNSEVIFEVFNQEFLI